MAEKSAAIPGTNVKVLEIFSPEKTDDFDSKYRYFITKINNINLEEIVFKNHDHSTSLRQ
jgi:hypothetical protein